MVEYLEGIPILRPFIDLDNKAYWDAVQNHKLVVQRCSKCDRYLQPPRPMCPECRSMDTLEWAESTGKGFVYSYIIYTTDRMAYPAIKLPYAVVLVELEEGVRIVSNTVDIDTEEIHIGMPVEVTFVEAAKDLTLYMFKKRDA